MSHARLLRFDLEDPVHGQVPNAALLPMSVPITQEPRALPSCLFLYGGGGSRESLASLQATFEAAWSAGQLAPCVLVTPDVGPWSFYLEDPARGYAWESFICERLVPHVHAMTRAQQVTAAAAGPLRKLGAPGLRPRLGVFGMSMGGYGALKLTFAHPQLFAAVGAVSPMIEPFTEANAVPLRNRFFYPAEVPQALLGPARDAALYRAEHPTARARAHVTALLDHKPAIYIDAASRDAFNAHDGAEHLHRTLWELDIPHEYHLRRDSDHAGPDLAQRTCVALQWVVQHLSPPAATPLTELERAWLRWLDDPETAQPSTPLAPESSLFPRWLRHASEPQRTAAEQQDPSVRRTYGCL